MSVRPEQVKKQKKLKNSVRRNYFVAKFEKSNTKFKINHNDRKNMKKESG